MYNHKYVHVVRLQMNKKGIQPAWFEQVTLRLNLTSYSLVLFQLN